MIFLENNLVCMQIIGVLHDAELHTNAKMHKAIVKKTTKNLGYKGYLQGIKLA